MISEPSYPVAAGVTSPSVRVTFLPTLCWGAIIGGTIAAVGVHILLTALGVGAGLAAFTPLTDENPLVNFNIGAAAIWTLCALVALLFGGFVAGRFSHSVNSGFIHGMLVWCLTLAATIMLVSQGTGMIMGGALKVLRDGIGMGGKLIAAGAGEVAKEGVKRVGGQLESFIDEAVQSSPTNASPHSVTKAKREIGFAVTKLFAPGNDVSSPENRAAAIKAMTENAGMSEENATKALDAWTTSYQSLKLELARAREMAEKQARETADVVAGNLSSAALWSFFGMLTGLLAASFAGSYGAGCALKRTVMAQTVPSI